mgnify:CR=1 FL=1
MRYNNGIVYIILNDLGQCYVGSTIQSLKIRLQKHLSDYRGHTDLGRKYRAYRSSFEVLSGTNFEIFPLEHFACSNVSELETRECQWIIKLLNYCNIVNINLPVNLADNEISDSENLIINENIKKLLFI